MPGKQIQFVFDLLGTIYIAVIAFLIFLAICILVSAHRKFGVIPSIRLFLKDRKRFEHGMIAQIVAGVVLMAILLFLIGVGAQAFRNLQTSVAPHTLDEYLQIHFILVLAVLIIPPTLLGFQHTSIGVAVGLYGGLLGMFSYAVGLGGWNAYERALWLWLPLNLAGYIAGWMAGTIVVGQRKCEALVFALDIKIRNARDIIRVIPDLVSSFVGAAHSELTHANPIITISKSGIIAMNVEPGSTGGLRLRQVVTCRSQHRRTFEEIARTFSAEKSYHTPSQLMGAYLNSFASYKTVVTLQTCEERTDVLKMGVVVFHESPSLVWCSEKTFHLIKRIYAEILEGLKKHEYEIVWSLSPSLAGFPGNIQRSHEYVIDSLEETRPYSANLSKEYVNSLSYIEALVLEPTLIDRIRDSKLLKLVAAFLNSFLAYVYNQALAPHMLYLIKQLLGILPLS